MDAIMIIGAVIAVVIAIVFAAKFAELAEEKGYSNTPYFWICFVFGVIGYCMVAALPDLVLRKKLNKLDAHLADTEQNTAAGAVVAATAKTWKCTCGRVNLNCVSTCNCGKSKRECLNKY